MLWLKHYSSSKMSHFISIFFAEAPFCFHGLHNLTRVKWQPKRSAVSPTSSRLIPLRLPLTKTYQFPILPGKIHRGEMKPNIPSKKKLSARIHRRSRALCCMNCCSLLFVFGLTALLYCTGVFVFIIWTAGLCVRLSSWLAHYDLSFLFALYSLGSNVCR